MFENVKSFILHLHISDSGSEERIIQKLSDLEINLGAQIMATVEQIQEAIAAEKTEVAYKIASLTDEIVALQAQLAAGVGVTVEQLDAILAGVQGIFVPAVVVDPVEPDPVV